ncbi:methyltransferase domain-containing protein [bacterium]|nr:methyltransferase domain-containing protein [bacterium]
MDAFQQKERTRRIYNEVAPFYDRLRLVCRRNDIPYVLELLDPQESDRVLDAGMGPGIYSFAILQKHQVGQVVGIDLSEQFVAMARKRAARKDYSNCEFKTADLEQLPFEEGSFDKIVCSGVLLLIPDQNKALKELLRVLRPGGKIVFVEPLDKVFIAKECFYVAAKMFIKVLAVKNRRLRGLNRNDFAGHYFSEESLSRLLNSVGFNSVQVIRNGVEIYGICQK